MGHDLRQKVAVACGQQRGLVGLGGLQQGAELLGIQGGVQGHHLELVWSGNHRRTGGDLN